MRKINKIVIHCSATRAGVPVTIADVTRWHKDRGFRTVGYHRFIRLNGLIEIGRADNDVGAGVFGHNSDSLHICYAGGLDAHGRPADTRTEPQLASMRVLARDLHRQYPDAEFMGHRDLSPDRDGDGVISPQEWLKACPCFDVRAWIASLGFAWNGAR